MAGGNVELQEWLASLEAREMETIRKKKEDLRAKVLLLLRALHGTSFHIEEQTKLKVPRIKRRTMVAKRMKLATFKAKQLIADAMSGILILDATSWQHKMKTCALPNLLRNRGRNGRLGGRMCKPLLGYCSGRWVS
ncbi:hypothetical protein HAX54_014348 [Datura stramonium]|uniref:Uncharacterized protein n=1 Tax=Datura stramonium TaxID=4076 RepID=A0ABS8TMZ9_DATST|nr:hypothetical protein [Datura stramonium]